MTAPNSNPYGLDASAQVDPTIRREVKWAAAAPAAPDVGEKRVSAGVKLITNAGAGVGVERGAVEVVPEAATPVAVAVTDVGRVFTNEGAAALIVFNLPTAAANLTFDFVVQDADGLQVVAAAGDTINLAGVVSAVAGNAKSFLPGATLRLVAINATEWIAMFFFGPWLVT